MQQHILCHTESETTTKFKCSVCRDVKFTKWRQCSLHLWKKHQIGLYIKHSYTQAKQCIKNIKRIYIDKIIFI